MYLKNKLFSNIKWKAHLYILYIYGLFHYIVKINIIFNKSIDLKLSFTIFILLAKSSELILSIFKANTYILLFSSSQPTKPSDRFCCHFSASANPVLPCKI